MGLLVNVYAYVVGSFFFTLKCFRQNQTMDKAYMGKIFFKCTCITLYKEQDWSINSWLMAMIWEWKEEKLEGYYSEGTHCKVRYNFFIKAHHMVLNKFSVWPVSLYLSTPLHFLTLALLSSSQTLCSPIPIFPFSLHPPTSWTCFC